MSGLRPVTVITGASAGIGVALARVFARHGHELVLVARRKDRLNALADEIAGNGQPRPTVIALDLAQQGAARQIAEVMEALGVEPQYVVNNAGFGLVGVAASLDRSEQLSMIDVNMRSLTELSLAYVDSMARQRRAPECRIDRRLSARPRQRGLLRQQGLCAVVVGSAA